MIEAIDRIERYAARGREAFDRDELIQSWFIRHLQILGEAARALPDDIRQKAPDIGWKKITGMRHVVGGGGHRVSFACLRGTPSSVVNSSYVWRPRTRE
jgi:uncharacterized protein with HEPN domain